MRAGRLSLEGVGTDGTARHGTACVHGKRGPWAGEKQGQGSQRDTDWAGRKHEFNVKKYFSLRQVYN